MDSQRYATLDFDQYHQVELPRLIAAGHGELAVGEARKPGRVRGRGRGSDVRGDEALCRDRLAGYIRVPAKLQMAWLADPGTGRVRAAYAEHYEIVE